MLLRAYRLARRVAAMTRDFDQTKGQVDTIARDIASLTSKVDRLTAWESPLDEHGRRMTLAEPITVPLEKGMFYAKVKIDHEGVFRPRPASYEYQSVKDVLVRHQPQIAHHVDAVEKAAAQTGFGNIPLEQVDETEPYINNPMFQGNDARALYGLIAHLKPKRIIEVGSGHSTRFMRRAIRDAQLDTELVAIDPVPRAEIRGIASRVILKSVQETDLDCFRQLEAGDILFWDGSHITFNGTDSVMFYLEILPLLKPGVHVHVHDIQLPSEYEAGYCAHYYNEQYMLATVLLNSSAWQPTLPLHYIGKYVTPTWGGRSFWMQKAA